MKLRRGLVIVAVILVEFMSVQQSHGGAVNAEPHEPVMTQVSFGGDHRAKREETISGQSTNSSNVQPVDKVSSTAAGSAGGSVLKINNATGTPGGGGTIKDVKQKTLIIPDRSKNLKVGKIFVFKNGL